MGAAESVVSSPAPSGSQGGGGGNARRVCAPVFLAGEKLLGKKGKHKRKSRRRTGLSADGSNGDPFALGESDTDASDDELNVVPRREMLDAEELMKKHMLAVRQNASSGSQEHDETDNGSDGEWADQTAAHDAEREQTAEATDQLGLCDAVRAGRLSQVKRLLRQQPDSILEVDAQGNSALYVACGVGSVDMVHALLEVRADVEQCNVKGVSPLRLAACKGRVTVVDRLLEAKAAIDSTALLGAAFHGQDSVVSSFIEAHRFDGHHLDLEMRTRKGDSALLVAADRGHVAVINTLLEASADTNARNRQGYTALMRAASHGYEQVCQILLDAGASALPSNVFDHDAMKIAQLAHHVDVVHLIAGKYPRQMQEARLLVLMEVHAGRRMKGKVTAHPKWTSPNIIRARVALEEAKDDAEEDGQDNDTTTGTGTGKGTGSSDKRRMAISPWRMFGGGVKGGSSALVHSKHDQYAKPASLRVVLGTVFEFVGAIQGNTST